MSLNRENTVTPKNAQLPCFEAKLHIFLQVAENAIPSDADLERYLHFDELVRKHKYDGERKVTVDDFLTVLDQPAPTGRMPETWAGHLAFKKKFIESNREEPFSFTKLLEAEVKEFDETTLGMPFSAKSGTRFQRIALLNAWSNAIVNKNDPNRKLIFKGKTPKPAKAADGEEDCKPSKRDPPKTRSQSAAAAGTAPAVGDESPPKKLKVLRTLGFLP